MSANSQNANDNFAEYTFLSKQSQIHSVRAVSSSEATELLPKKNNSSQIGVGVGGVANKAFDHYYTSNLSRNKTIITIV